MAFEDIHVEPCKGGQPEPCSKPAALSRRTAHGPSYDVRAIVRAALRRNASALVWRYGTVDEICTVLAYRSYTGSTSRRVDEFT